MNKVKTTERGWAGHFICADSCKFRRNTLIEYGNIKIVVSTVGAYYYNGEVQSIGHNRYYETMAFHTDPQDVIYNDINVGKQVSFESNWALDKYDTPTIDNDANDMHEAVVKEISSRLKKGDLFEVETY